MFHFVAALVSLRAHVIFNEANKIKLTLTLFAHLIICRHYITMEEEEEEEEEQEEEEEVNS